MDTPAPSNEVAEPAQFAGLLIGFVGYGSESRADKAGAFEDDVLALLPDHGARVVFRGRRSEGQPDRLPLEMHLLWFPSRAAFDSYLADPRRTAVLEKYGEVFTDKQAVELTVVTDMRRPMPQHPSA